MAVLRIGLILAAVTVVVLLLGGCGGSGAAAGGGGAQAHDPLLQVARCMRAHGVSPFPDPTPGGGGLVVPNGIDVKTPAFQAAQRACNRLLPEGGPSARPSAAGRRELVSLARCIRTHGVPGFQDPTTAPPRSPPPGAVAVGSGGMFLVVRAPEAPAFRRAAAACHFPLPH